MNINHKNTHINTIQKKENKQLNIQQKQNYPGLVASYDTQPGNEVGLFYNGPEHPHGPTAQDTVKLFVLSCYVGLYTNILPPKQC